MSRYIRKTNKARYIHGQSVTDAFWSRVNKDGPIHPVLLTKCWLWTAGTVEGGYGKMMDSERNTVTAHRVSWVIHFGDFDGTLNVCHKCDNPPCVNPDHLFLGTYQDNKDDSVSKDRHCRGERNRHAKLTEELVIHIRQLCDQGANRSEIARQLGMSKGTICRIANRLIWKHLPG